MVSGAVTYNGIGELEPLNIRNEMHTTAPEWRDLVDKIWNPSRYVKGLSLLAGYVAGEVYSIYAVFDAHSLLPVSAYLTEQMPQLRAVSGKYREVFDLSGLLSVLVTSLVAFTLAWCVVRAIALALASSTPSSPSVRPPSALPTDPANGPMLAFDKY
jgi:hypothetical protein